MKRKHPDAICEECPLAKASFVPSDGPTGAKVAVVSRSPGRYEAVRGRPFTGPSGKVLDHLLTMHGAKREEILATNIVLCETDSPSKEAVRCCSPRLFKEIQSADTVIAAGSEAATLITGVTSLSGNRGFVHERDIGTGRNQRVILTNNPAMVLRDDSSFPNLVRDFKLALDPLPPPKLPEVHWTNEIRTAKNWIRSLAGKRGIESVDIETRGLSQFASLASIGFSRSGDRAIAFGERVVTNEDFVRTYLRPYLEDQDVRYLWHNGKFDVRNLRRKSVWARVDEDTLLLSYALDERSDEEQVHSLSYLVKAELGWHDYEPKIVKEWKSAIGRLEKAGKFKELEELDVPDELYEYNAYDAAGTAQLYPILRNRADSDSVLDTYKNLLLPGSESLTRVEMNGIRFNVDRACDILEDEVLPKLDELRIHLQWKVGDGKYNPNSADQNSALVYDRWGITHNISRRGKDRSVDKPVYTEIKAGRFDIPRPSSGSEDQSGSESDAELEDVIRITQKETIKEWADLLAQFKELDKQRGTYLESLAIRAERYGGRLYTDFKLLTVTGRLKSSNPNFQNVTRTKAGLPSIRSLFMASEGRKIMAADYSQAELRTIAALSGDEEFNRIYRSGVSLHKQVAERFYGENYTYEQYVRAKNMDFGTAYGQTAYTFQEKHDIPEKEGAKFIKWWWEQFPGVAVLRDSVHKQVLSNGYVQTPFGRKRRFYLITKENKAEILREAFNFLIQSTAHDFTLWSLIQLVIHRLNPDDASVIIEGHDSIICDVKEECIDEVAQAIREVMIAAPKETLNWDFPFDVEIQTGDNWGELDDYSTAGNAGGQQEVSLDAA